MKITHDVVLTLGHVGWLFFLGIGYLTNADAPFCVALLLFVLTMLHSLWYSRSSVPARISFALMAMLLMALGVAKVMADRRMKAFQASVEAKERAIQEEIQKSRSKATP